ncbi:phosphatase PAP2 family protein [Legionella oakridgensis]|uniref:Inositolphosphotransferase Aur1/Ipt1 domain-containing protein n=1 Tax=Legionella oakridgensis TaxID=29423 RepID=A0A0W0XIP3_9GAMM|nr:phosphatase PAP2 family protein [Legionella oakridgensis]ETO93243.1 PAP2 superfamily [Legionella oakridgensis RV-2-2007]KTD44477.1 hypothetical protein Loak_0177 [Legionella oakridgensis]STY20154.1 Uncharacterised protein [Legionella longbeachae]
MRTLKTTCIISSGAGLCGFAIIVMAINYFFYQYPGNNYIPPIFLTIALFLLLTYSGAILQYGRSGNLTLMIKEAIYYYTVVMILLFACNAIQYTPFPPIDKYILKFESSLYINMEGIVRWTREHPNINTLLMYSYRTLDYQLNFIPILVIAAKRFQLMREYYFLLFSSALIGYTFYYFFPTTAPASVIDSPLFFEAQRATGLKFQQIHSYIQPTTLEGGMIATPSFHAIWAWFCLYLLRPWPIAFGILLIVNLLLFTSCILLGWHYPIDLVASVIIVLIAHKLYAICQRPLYKKSIYKP